MGGCSRLKLLAAQTKQRRQQRWNEDPEEAFATKSSSIQNAGSVVVFSKSKRQKERREKQGRNVLDESITPWFLYFVNLEPLFCNKINSADWLQENAKNRRKSFSACSSEHDGRHPYTLRAFLNETTCRAGQKLSVF